MFATSMKRKWGYEAYFNPTSSKVLETEKTNRRDEKLSQKQLTITNFSYVRPG
jgi:hypothetical protein